MWEPRNEQAFIQLPTHGQATRDYSHFPLMVKTSDLGFADGAQATCDNSLMIVAGGLRAKGRLSFKTGVFDAVEPSKVSRRALWDKNENSTPRVRNEFMKLSQLLSPRPIKRDVVSFGGTRFGRRRKLGVTGMMRRQNRSHQVRVVTHRTKKTLDLQNRSRVFFALLPE